MTIHRIKLKDLDESYIRKLKSEQKDDNKEVVIWISEDTNMMDDETFWKIISDLNLDTKNNDEALQNAIDTLSHFSVKEIKAFENSLSKKLFVLDGLKFAQNIGDNSYVDNNSPFSTDSFLYARCAVVAKGPEFFDRVLDKPEAMVKNETFEQLLGLAAAAYARKTGKTFDHIPAYIYETFANSEGWGNKGLLERIFK